MPGDARPPPCASCAVRSGAGRTRSTREPRQLSMRCVLTRLLDWGRCGPQEEARCGSNFSFRRHFCPKGVRRYPVPRGALCGVYTAREARKVPAFQSIPKQKYFGVMVFARGSTRALHRLQGPVSEFHRFWNRISPRVAIISNSPSSL